MACIRVKKKRMKDKTVAGEEMNPGRMDGGLSESVQCSAGKIS